MEREILFRGYSKYGKGWLYGDLVRNVEGDFAVRPPYGMDMENRCDIYEVIPDTIEQYTGIKDKNGNRIFEGDILGDLKSSVIGYVKGGVRGYCYDVIYPKPIHGEKDWSLYGTVVNDYKGNVKIVGNIHDNPELLK